MDSSILTSLKKALGIAGDYVAFDEELIMHINSVLATLSQLGVGPIEGFVIEDATPTWADFIGTNKRLNIVKSYLYLRVRMLFDPPSQQYVISAYKEQIIEQEWRLQVEADPMIPQLIPIIDDLDINGEIIISGGTP